MISSVAYPRLRSIFDVAGKQRQIALLEQETSQPDFWADQEKAQHTMRQISQLSSVVSTWGDLQKKVADIATLVDMSLAEDDRSLEGDIAQEIAHVGNVLEDLEFQLQLGGKHDSTGAILAIHAGAGGTESQDWAQMLLRMYLRWSEKRRFQADVIDVSQGEEAGIKSVLVRIDGEYAYGYLKGERGVHRLVRISPFDASHSRHTSFALVEVMPVVDDTVDVTINTDDLKIDVFRSSGPGGQHMQKTSSAVRVTHLPTGIVVSCQNERSQLRNKEVALGVLRSRLLELELEKKAAEDAKLKGAHVAAGWGNQIRSYVLHPYKLVKDHRTGHETSDTSSVLDGDLDELLKAYLRSTVQG